MNVQWHKEHKLSKGATPMKRLSWHEAHQKFCGCSPVPKDVARYLPPSTDGTSDNYGL